MQNIGNLESGVVIPKCKKCQCNLPEDTENLKDEKPTWFGKYTHIFKRVEDIALRFYPVLIEWVCVDCWNKGERLTEF